MRTESPESHYSLTNDLTNLPIYQGLEIRGTCFPEIFKSTLYPEFKAVFTQT